MVGKIQRRNNRKARVSGWFARERDRDMQVFDIGLLTSGVGAYLSALRRERSARRSGSVELVSGARG